MLARLLAIIVVTLAIIGPGIILWRFAWNHGGAPRKLAIATLMAALLLMGWLFLPAGQDSTIQARITRFVGAWGILFMAVGLITIFVTALMMFRARSRNGPKRDKPPAP